MFVVTAPDSAPLPTAREILAAYACGKDRCACVRSLTASKGVTHCPAHEDRDPSFSVSDGEDRTPLFHCFAGCAPAETIAAMQRDRVWPEAGSTNSLRGGTANGTGPACPPRTRWAYQWEIGTVIAYHKRVDKANGKKAFVWELPDGRTSAGEVAIADLPLYRRVEVLSAPADAVILVTEGEKAADAAAEHGFVSTSFGGGAGQRDFGRALEDLRGRHVALWRDNDSAGELLMERLAEGLRGVAASVRVIDVPGLPAKGDAFDYFAAGRPAAEIAALVASPGVQAQVRHFEIISAPDFINRPAPRWLVQGFLHEQSFAAILGGPGSLKTFIGIDLVASLTLGLPFQGFATTRAGSGLYILGEGAGGFAQRLKAWQKHRGIDLPSTFKVLPFAVPLIDHTSIRQLIADVLSFGEQFEVIVVDTLSRSLAGEDENASVPMTKAVQAAGMLQQALRCCVIVIHHGRKSDGEMRGHGSLRGALDAIIVADRDRSTGNVRVECWKQKDGLEFTPFVLRPIVVDLSEPVNLHSVGADQPSSLVLERLSQVEERAAVGSVKLARLTESQRTTLRALVRFGPTGETGNAWRAAAMQAQPDLTRQAFSRQVGTLIEKYQLVSIVTVRDGDGVYVVDGRVAEALNRQTETPAKEGTDA